MASINIVYFRTYMHTFFMFLYYIIYTFNQNLKYLNPKLSSLIQGMVCLYFLFIDSGNKFTI